jgi:hypothetical protein
MADAVVVAVDMTNTTTELAGWGGGSKLISKVETPMFHL